MPVLQAQARNAHTVRETTMGMGDGLLWLDLSTTSMLNPVWAAPQGTVEVILRGNTMPVATQLPPQHLWLAAG